MAKTPRALRRSSGHALLWVTLLLFPLNAYAQGEQWQVGTSPGFSSGRYGTDTRTDVFYTPITARRLFEDGDLTFVIPMTCIRGNGGVIVVNGMPVRQERLDATGQTGTRTGTDSTRTGTTAAAPTTTACGLGDIIVRGRYYVLDERAWVPTIALRAHVKAPTASAEKGLGTGRPDEGVAVEVSRTIRRGLMAMVDGGYTVIGDRPGFDLNNTWWYDVGLGQNLAKDIVNVSVFVEKYRALVEGLEHSRELVAAVSVKSANGWRVQFSGSKGLSDGAPDRGFTLGASRRF
jgi:hypothetical protein